MCRGARLGYNGFWIAPFIMARDSKIVARLIVIKGPDEGKQFELSETTHTVGRDSSSKVRLSDTEVSRRHAEFRRSGDNVYRLLDVGSANGTFVNNQPIKDVELRSGDHIRIGQSILVYSAGRKDGSSQDLTRRVSMIGQKDDELSSAI